MTYPFEAEGAERDRELPFRVGVIADLAGDPGVPLLPPAERCFVPLGEDGIAGAMARLEPGLRLEFGGQGEDASVRLTFRSLADFEPASLSHQLAAAGMAPTDDRLEGIRRNERFQGLEAAWRGLDLLAARAGNDPAVRICILPASRAEFDAALRPSVGDAPGWLRRCIDHDIFQCRGAEPFGLLVGDQAWTAAAEDIETLGLMAAIAAPVFAPYVSDAEDSLCELGCRAGPGEKHGTAEAAWQALRGSDASRFLVLTTPQETKAVAGPFWVAARLVDAFRRDGFCADVPGAEQLAWGQPEAPLARCGFMPVVQRASDAPPTIVGVLTVHRPRTYERPEASMNAAIGAALPYVMVTARIAHYLKAMTRDRIGAFAEAGDLERWMARWLSNLARAGARGEGFPRHPLYQSRLEVKAVPDRPHTFDAVCYLRPWLVMAELTTEMRMVVRLPRQQ
jgi:type VI secretion system protein ImpC